MLLDCVSFQQNHHIFRLWSSVLPYANFILQFFLKSNNDTTFFIAVCHNVIRGILIVSWIFKPYRFIWNNIPYIYDKFKLFNDFPARIFWRNDFHYILFHVKLRSDENDIECITVKGTFLALRMPVHWNLVRDTNILYI